MSITDERSRAKGDFAAFEREFAAERAAVWRRLYERHQDVIRIKKEKVALPNLELIVGATLRLSNQTSFRAMSLRDLSRETGISMGALYSYIESKDRLLSMILGQVLHMVEVVLDAPEGRSLAPRERLRWLLRRHVFLTEAMQPWFFFAYMEAKSFDRWGKRMAIESELHTERLFADCLAAGQAAGAFVAVDTTMAASLIKPLLQDWYLKRWKYRRRRIDPDDYADCVIRFVEAAWALPTVPTHGNRAMVGNGSMVGKGPGGGASRIEPRQRRRCAPRHVTDHDDQPQGELDPESSDAQRVGVPVDD